jgi:hypothetical protein
MTIRVTNVAEIMPPMIGAAIYRIISAQALGSTRSAASRLWVSRLHARSTAPSIAAEHG